jgi:hypothetical protein
LQLTVGISNRGLSTITAKTRSSWLPEPGYQGRVNAPH